MTLTQRIQVYVRRYPGCTATTIANAVGATAAVVSGIAYRLWKQKAIGRREVHQIMYYADECFAIPAFTIRVRKPYCGHYPIRYFPR